jgi:UDP-N-acetylglucosamine 2-epimerase (non-hydrolysing)
MSMPEEINRLCTDVLCDFLFTTDHFADENLRAEGVSADRIFFVGNVMIDTLLKHRGMAEGLALCGEWGLKPRGFATVTLHRPANVDDPEVLRGILEALHEIGKDLPIVFPMHPRTLKKVQQFGFGAYFSNGPRPRGLWTTEPLGYLEFLHLNMNARMVFTDSGGLQEETTVLGVPCITLRHNTERPITCEVGTNFIAGSGRDSILRHAAAVLNGAARPGTVPEKWDGRAAERIVKILADVDGAAAPAEAG